MVIINLQIAIGYYFNIKKTMTRKKRQHMVEKADPGVDFGAATAIQVDSNRNLGF